MLRLGVTDRHHPFHAPVVTNSTPLGPAGRTVVLRSVDADSGSLAFHSDSRSPKMSQLKVDPRVQWLFYSVPDKIQIRLSALAEIHQNDDRARQAWERTALSSRRAYTSHLAPGTILTTPHNSFDEALQHRAPTEEESQLGRPNFTVIETRVETIDWLWLEARGNTRALFERQARGDWTENWIAP
jgi:pyridoxamine 5'-phosphate oxidase